MDLGALGEFKSTVDLVGNIAAAGVALVNVVDPELLWAPKTRGLPKFAARIFGIASGIGLVVLRSLAGSVLDSPRFLWLAAGLGAAGLVFAFVYYAVRLRLLFNCAGDSVDYVDGRVPNANAQAVLEGRLAGLPAQYALIHPPLPVNARQFFCRSGKDDPLFIWRAWPYVRSHLALLASYGLFIVPLTLALASAAIGWDQLKVEKTAAATKIELPADILFDFDKAELQVNADTLLKGIARDLKDHKVRKLRIEGYSDAKGEAAYDKQLSERRAKAVEQWLKGPGGLGDVDITSVGLGKEKATVPASASDAERAKDRKVAIVVEGPT